jgi:hypothetical protein
VGLGFIQNRGQWDSQAKFLLPGNGLNLWLTADGPVMDVHRFVPEAGNTPHMPKGHLEGDVIRTTFVGANPVSVAPTKQLAGNINYLVGQNKSKWVTQVPHFAEATSTDIYPRIRARYYVDSGSPRYDLIVDSGADPSRIGLKIDGAEGIQVLGNGNLQIQTSLGPIEERGLVAYQQSGLGNRQVACKMTVNGNTVQFKLGDYDKNRPLVIDPLVYCTLLEPGQVESDFSNGDLYGSVVDSTGAVIVANGGASVSLPTTTGAYQKTTTESSGVPYVSKVSSDGKQLIFATFISGTKAAGGTYPGGAIIGVALDQAGNVVVAGATSDEDFPTTALAYQKVSPWQYPWQPWINSFVARLSFDGSKLLSSTYFGAQNGVDVEGFGLDHEGNAILLAKVHWGSNIQASPGAYQTSFNSQDQAPACVAKLDPEGRLLACTFLPGCGSSTIQETSNSFQLSRTKICVDAADNIVIAAPTINDTVNKTFVPITASAYMGQMTNALSNSFVVKLNADLTTLIFGTYFPCTVADTEIQPDGSILVVGYSRYDTFPTTPGTYSTGLSGGGICISRLSGDGSTLLNSAQLRCSNTDGAYSNGFAVATESGGNILVGGSSPAGFPTTANAFQANDFGGGLVIELSSDLSKLLNSTYFAGNGGSRVHGIFPQGAGNVVLEGLIFSGDFPTTPGALHSSSSDDSRSVYIAKLSLPVYTSLHLSANPVTGGFSVAGTLTLPDKAQAGGVVVQLNSSNPNAMVPASVTVPANQSSATFTVITAPAVKVTAGTITASLNGGTGSAGLTVLPAALTSIGVVATEIAAGTSASVTVKLNGQAAGSGDLIALSTSSSALTVPATVPVYHGSTLAAFAATTSSVTVSTPVTITANFGGVKKTIVVTVDPMLSNFSVTPTSVVGGVAALGTATIAGKAGASGVVLNLSSSNAVLTVPATITIPAAGNYKTFALASQGVNAATVVTVTGKEGTLTKTFTITVNPASLLSLTSTVSSVVGGQALNLVVKLNGNAGSNGLAVTLSSSNPAIVAPSGVAIAPNTSSKVFTVTSKTVTAVTHVTISAKFGTQTQSTVVTVNPKS